MNVNFTPEEMEAIEYTIKKLKWWADEGYQYTSANCEAKQQTVGEIIMKLSGITQDEKPPTCRYQVSLLNALNKFDIFYERILCENESMAKHIEAKRNRLKEYTRDIPNEDDVPAPWVARGYADDLVQTLQSIVEKSRGDSIPKPPEETGQENGIENKPNGKSHKIFGDTIGFPWGPQINYKNLWHKVKNWPCVTKIIKTIRNFIECKLKNNGPQ